MDKIFEINLRFHVKYCTTEKNENLAFSNFSIVMTKLSF